jgi:uncharacterized protein (TIGR02001 family)
MKHVMTKTAVALALAGAASMAQAEFSANVALTTDYVWRGASQSDEAPAIQGGFDYSHESGFYVGTWGSNVDWDEATANPVDMEWDVYGGFGGEIGNGLSFDVGVIRYMYPDTDADYDWTELYGSLGFAFTDSVSASVGVAHSSDVFATSEDGTYVNLGLDVSLPQDFGLSFGVGHYSFDQLDDYTDYKIAVSKSLGGFDFELAYTDTNDDNWWVGSDGSSYTDGRAFLSVSKSF